MKVLFLTEGGSTPASRYRVEQFFPHFRRLGIEPTLRGAYGPLYHRAYDAPWGPAYKVLTRGRRAVMALDSAGFDAVLWQRTAFPQVALPERLAVRRNPRVLFDFDDAVFLAQAGPSRARERTFRAAVALAAHVIAGNAYLAERAAAPEKTTVIPTVIDTDLYTPKEAGTTAGPPVIGWIGSASLFPLIEGIVAPLTRVLSRHPEVRARFVSNRVFAPLASHPRVEQVPWSAESELALLRSFDVGLMPLEDDAFTRGKCGFKMIQYLAVGVPALVSDLPVNRGILGDSGAGELVAGPDGWEPALERMLARTAAERRALGEQGRARIVERYSIRAVLPLYQDLFERVAAGQAD